MKRIITLVLGLALVLVGLAGCQNQGESVKVTIEGDGQFPSFLAGKWKSDEHDWEFVFDPDGKISSAVISFGKTEIIPGKTTRFPTWYGGKGIFEPGVWNVFYSPQNRMLSVEAVIKHFYQDLGPNAIEGNNTDLLVGPVSEDGKVWWPEWYTCGRYIAYTPKPNEFNNQPEPEWRGSLIFDKVSPEK